MDGETKKAWWIYHHYGFYCSNCWSEALVDYEGEYDALSPYCPFCGLPMEVPKDAKYIKPINITMNNI